MSTQAGPIDPDSTTWMHRPAGTTFTYVRASLLLVQDQTTTQQPPFMFDTTLGKPGFVDPSGAHVTVALTTKVRLLLRNLVIL